VEVATEVMARREKEFDAIEQRILQQVYDNSAEFRNY